MFNVFHGNDILLYSSAAISAFSLLYYAYHRYRGGNYAPHCRLDGKVVVLTGATSGIGKAAAEELVRRGAIVVLACRNLAAANKLALDLTSQAVKKNEPGRATAMLLDLASMESVHHFVNILKQDFSKIDILINNAAVWGNNQRVVTRDGNEEHLQVNHLAPLAVSLLSMPLLRKAEDSRIVFVSSDLYKRGYLDYENLDMQRSYSPFQAYANSKLIQVLCGQEFARRLGSSSIKSQSNVSIFTMRPGIVSTGLFKNAVRNPIAKFFATIALFLLLKTPYQGAQTLIYCAATKKLRGESGKFYGNCLEEPLKTEISRDENAAKKIFDISLKKIGLEHYSF